MRSRWVHNWSSPEPPTVARTVVARWLPMSYHLVLTLELRTATSDDSLSALVREMNPDVRDAWQTRVFKCSRDGLSHSDESLYRREYTDEDSAKRGHSEIVEALQTGQHRGALHGYSQDEVMRLSGLRAVEWLSWPAFISQPVLPIFYLFWPWYSVLIAVAVANVLWRFVRYKFVSYTMAAVGCLFVRLKWPVMLILASYSLWHGQYFLAALTLATPLVVMAMIPLSTGMVGAVQRKFVDELLFESDQQALADAEKQ